MFDLVLLLQNDWNYKNILRLQLKEDRKTQRIIEFHD